MSRCLPILISFFIRFLTDFCSFFILTSTQDFQLKSSPLVFSVELVLGVQNVFEVRIDLWCDFGANLAPFYILKSTKNQKKKTIPRAIEILIVFCFNVFSIFVPLWEPSWSHVGHRFGPKTLPRRPKTPPGRPQDASSRLQDTSRRPKTFLVGLW